MPNISGKKIVILGCGNLAWHLAMQFSKLKFELVVWNHKSSKELSKFEKAFSCKISSGKSNIPQNADFYFVCISDSHISSISAYLHPHKESAIVCHTSGSQALIRLKNKSGIKGVLYPLQSFSKKDKLHWKEIPLMIEAENKSGLQELKKLAKLLSDSVTVVNTNNRQLYHLCAVFINNFGNALFSSVELLLNEEKLNNNKHLFVPLQLKTLEKAINLGALKSQTGPAIRNDKETIKLHQQKLKNKKELLEVYNAITTLIQKKVGKGKL
ncbi:MAG: DUF2520 domain-containing protein [Sphingobacteriaceae bacterium]|nr:DUF2520 domain-containing protein [Sphingobacteriaceae bacterium]